MHFKFVCIHSRFVCLHFECTHIPGLFVYIPNVSTFRVCLCTFQIYFFYIPNVSITNENVLHQVIKKCAMYRRFNLNLWARNHSANTTLALPPSNIPEPQLVRFSEQPPFTETGDLNVSHGKTSPKVVSLNSSSNFIPFYRRLPGFLLVE